MKLNEFVRIVSHLNPDNRYRMEERAAIAEFHGNMTREQAEAQTAAQAETIIVRDETCQLCDGRGKVGEQPCANCNGQGRIVSQTAS